MVRRRADPTPQSAISVVAYPPYPHLHDGNASYTDDYTPRKHPFWLAHSTMQLHVVAAPALFAAIALLLPLLLLLLPLNQWVPTQSHHATLLLLSSPSPPPNRHHLLPLKQHNPRHPVSVDTTSFRCPLHLLPLKQTPSSSKQQDQLSLSIPPPSTKTTPSSSSQQIQLSLLTPPPSTKTTPSSSNQQDQLSLPTPPPSTKNKTVHASQVQPSPQAFTFCSTSFHSNSTTHASKTPQLQTCQQALQPPPLYTKGLLSRHPPCTRTLHIRISDLSAACAQEVLQLPARAAHTRSTGCACASTNTGLGKTIKQLKYLAAQQVTCRNYLGCLCAASFRFPACGSGTFTHTHASTHACTHAHVYIHTCARVYTHTHTHTHTRSTVCLHTYGSGHPYS